MPDDQGVLDRCGLHDVQNCDLCRPPEFAVRRGPNSRRSSSYVSVRGGKGVYHHPECFNVTGDWKGAEDATFGERVTHTEDELRSSSLRPAECCQPPQFTR